MAGDSSTFEAVLARMARGQTHQPHLTLTPGRKPWRPGDAAPTMPPSRGLEGTTTRRQKKIKTLLIPRPVPLVRVMAVAALLLVAVLAAVSALVADRLLQLGAEVRSQDAYNPWRDLTPRELDDATLLDAAALEALIAQRPLLRQHWLLARFRAVARTGEAATALQVFAQAWQEDTRAVPAADLVLAVEMALRANEPEQADAWMKRVLAQQLDPGQRERLASLAASMEAARIARQEGQQ